MERVRVRGQTSLTSGGGVSQGFNSKPGVSRTLCGVTSVFPFSGLASAWGCYAAPSPYVWKLSDLKDGERIVDLIRDCRPNKPVQHTKTRYWNNRVSKFFQGEKFYSPSGYYCTLDVGITRRPFIFPASTTLAWLSSSDIAQARIRALDQMVPEFNQDLLGIVSILELGDVSRLYSTAINLLGSVFQIKTSLSGKSIRVKGPERADLRKTYNRLAKDDAYAAKRNLFDSVLGYDFGLRPMLSDIEALLDAERNIMAQLANFNEEGAKGYKRRYVEKFADTLLQNVTSAQESEYIWTELVYRNQARVSWDSKMSPSDALVRKYGLGLSMASVWEMTPFSFIVDYVLNIGRWLDRVAQSTEHARLRDRVESITSHQTRAYVFPTEEYAKFPTYKRSLLWQVGALEAKKIIPGADSGEFVTAYSTCKRYERSSYWIDPSAVMPLDRLLAHRPRWSTESKYWWSRARDLFALVGSASLKSNRRRSL